MMMTHNLPILFLLLMPVFAVSAAPAESGSADSVSQAQPLNSLFFTPQQRDILDRARRGDPTRGLAYIDDRDSIIGGFVQRTDGRTAVWIDGQIRYDLRGKAITRLKASDVGDSAGTIKIISGEINPGSSASAASAKSKPQKKAASAGPSSQTPRGISVSGSSSR